MISLQQFLTEELHDVIVKVGDYWRIKGHAGKGTNTPKRGYWKAKYETREKAENALKAYFSCENDLPKICKEPELNVKLSSVYFNIGLCYIYLGNKNIAEKYLKKALAHTEGILGNDVIHKLNADIFENLGVVYELMNRFKDSLIFYKKSLKLKFNLYGEAHDEVLELQYKISECYLSLKQF